MLCCVKLNSFTINYTIWCIIFSALHLEFCWNVGTRRADNLDSEETGRPRKRLVIGDEGQSGSGIDEDVVVVWSRHMPWDG
jgi:hypothetical protein